MYSEKWEAANGTSMFELTTVKELMGKNFPPLHWAIPGLLTEGLTLFGGKPKTGKSILCVQICLEIARGIEVLNSIKADPGGVIYLALEDSPRRLQERLKSQLGGLEPPDNFHLCFSSPKLDEESLSELLSTVQSIEDPKLVVIDTLGKIRPYKGSGTDSGYQADYQYASQLKELADNLETAVLVVHHLRKMPADDPIEALSGTNGLAGAADAIWILDRSRTKADALLTVTGRDIEERVLGLSFDKESLRWRISGEGPILQMTEPRQRILEVLKESEAEAGIGPGQIAEKLGYENSDSVRQILGKMVKDGEIKRADHGKYLPIG